MAISISQAPSDENLVVGPNVWVLSGLIVTEDAYALAVEIDGNTVATFQQPANPAGKCIFDASKLLQSYLSPELEAPSFYGTENPFEELITGTNGNEDFSGLTNGGSVILKYRIRYGSVTDNVITWTNYSGYKFVINGYKPFYDLNWNPNALLYAPNLTVEACESNPGDMGRTDIEWKYLSDFPYRNSAGGRTGLNQRITLDQYATLSWWNYLDNAATGDTYNFAPYVIEFDYRNSDGTVLEKTYASISGQTLVGPRTDINDQGAYTFNVEDYIGQFGVGPQNLKDADDDGTYGADLWISNANLPALDHYYVTLWTFNSCLYTDDGSPSIDFTDFVTVADYLLDPIYEMRYDVVSYDCQKFEPIQFSWINSFGTHDYYTFYKRNTETDNIVRNNYYQLPGSWAGTTYEVYPYNRGARTYSTQIVQSWTAQTDYMSELEGEYLRSLFLSPSVNIYWDGKWQSVELTSNSYEYQTFGRDKMFRYTITFNTATNPRVQRG
jgi:hypothetical protein